MLEALKAAAASIAQQLRPGSPSAGGARRFWWAPAALAVIGVGAGVGLLNVVSSQSAQLRGSGSGASTLNLEDANHTYNQALLERTLAYVSFGVAGAAA